ncbi:universal stress protein [Aliiglaciecola litoralis]|uniref:Universal stress protein n=1 Tax=Aliiglaciecola litoralis TaxID=582857 RepID=A0ABP3X0Q1_9ALTE
MFKNILLFIDPNVNSENMLQCALTLSKKFGSDISLCAVVQPIPQPVELAILEKYAKEILTAKQLDADAALTVANDFFKHRSIRVNANVLQGIPFVEIIRLVAQHHYDLVMMMTDNQKSSISEKFFGSTQMHLLRKCPSPVWILKPDSGPIFKRVLTPIDTLDNEDEPLNNALVEATKAVVEPGNESIHFVQVWSVYGEGYLSSRGGISEQTIDQLRAETLRDFQQNVELVISEQDWGDSELKTHFPRSNNPAEEIINLANKENIDLLIMGTVCRTGIAGFIIGNTAEKVLNEVSCSVLAFKPKGFISPVLNANVSDALA